MEGEHSWPGTATIDCPGPLRIGSSLGAMTYPFRGRIDEAHVTASVRYREGFVPLRGQLSADAETLALWHFEEGAGQVAGDSDGDRAGRLGATTVSDENDPVWYPVSCSEQ